MKHRIPALAILTLAALAAGPLRADEGSAKSSEAPAPADLRGNAEAAVVPHHGGLDQAVREAVLALHGAQVRDSYGQLTTPVVEPQRESADFRWAFGGVYFPVPDGVHAGPVAVLFIARHGAGGWEVALEDSERFNALAQRAPTSVMSAAERGLFAERLVAIRARQAAGESTLAVDVGLGMPFKKEGSVWGTAGVHGDSGTSRPYNAIDFWGGDARVLASRKGTAYKYCTNSRWPYIKLMHKNGWSTGYYHTRNQANISNGQVLLEGAFIGNSGVELPCGGSASGDHVHWTLWRDSGAAEAVDNKLIGGWVWHEGSQAYSGYAERNGKRVNAGQSGLINYGHGKTPPPDEPCSGTGCDKYSGSFSGSNDVNLHPSADGFQYGGGTLSAWLRGPDGTDFDLILGRYNSSTGQWDRVAGSDGPSSTEELTYNAGAGKYRWRINQVSGTGSYTLWTLRKPS
ncbi:M23 family metallopeptidase [Ideonella sp.]|uniref:M23 family metallopeptidase n=1 Tax=Ideonella sp. TaxID=1929293 RepID=UPI0035B4BB9E